MAPDSGMSPESVEGRAGEVRVLAWPVEGYAGESGYVKNIPEGKA